ncbi:MAG TPA: hypothetical protein VJ258_00925 [Candidatus Limnocylindrales bacterium]|nr:hypothetical protein [Candidatus Limnocylindrales bacterium]
MSRPSNVTTRTLLWAAMAVALLVAGCGAATATASPAATIAVSPSARISASPSAAASGFSGVSASATPTTTDQVTIGLHVDAALEDLLPSTIGRSALVKFSMPVSTYLASSPGGDKTLYSLWLVKLGKTPDDVNIAIADDLTPGENLVVQAIKVPGVDATTLTSSFADVASKAGWPVSTKVTLPKPVLEITDPTAQEAGVLGVAYAYAKDNVLYVVVTDDVSLLIQGLASLP